MTDVVSVANLDRRLRPSELRVYLLLQGELDTWDYRPVKHVWASHRLGLARQTVCLAIGHLVELGYLACGDSSGGLRSYRLVQNVKVDGECRASPR